MKRFVLALLVAFTAALGLSAAVATAAPPTSSPYPPNVPILIIENPEVEPGTPITITIVNCTPGETIEITIDGRTVVVPCTGTIAGSVTVTIDAPTVPGTYEVIVAIPGQPTLSGTVVVVPSLSAPPTSVPSPLPSTGSDGTMSTITTAALVLAAGIGLLVVTRIRRRTA